MAILDVEKLYSLRLWKVRLKIEILVTAREKCKVDDIEAFAEIEEGFKLQLQIIETMISEVEKLALPGKQKPAPKPSSQSPN